MEASIATYETLRHAVPLHLEPTSEANFNRQRVVHGLTELVDLPVPYFITVTGEYDGFSSLIGYFLELPDRVDIAVPDLLRFSDYKDLRAAVSKADTKRFVLQQAEESQRIIINLRKPHYTDMIPIPGMKNQRSRPETFAFMQEKDGVVCYMVLAGGNHDRYGLHSAWGNIPVEEPIHGILAPDAKRFSVSIDDLTRIILEEKEQQEIPGL